MASEMEEFSLEETDEDVDVYDDVDQSSTSDSDSDFDQAEAPANAKKRQKLSAGQPVKPVKPTAIKSLGKAAKPANEDIRDPQAHILEYMRRTNRPYSLLNVYENLHRNIPRSVLIRHLDSLVTNGQLVSKVYGKTKIYYLNQMDMQLPSEDERRQLEDDINKLEDDCAAMEKRLRDAEIVLTSIHSEISDENLKLQIESLEKQVDSLQTELHLLDGEERVIIPPEQKQALKRAFAKYRTAWIARKRLVLDAVEQIAEGMEKKPKDVIKLCDIETDAECGVNCVPSALV